MDTLCPDLADFTQQNYDAGVHQLFDSREEAHKEMLAVIGEVLTELRAQGIPLPTDKMFLRDTIRMWNFWQSWAPK